MPVKRMKEFLDSYRVKYICISHSPAYTALETAASARVLARELAKVVMVKLDGQMAMVVLPATRKVDLDRLKNVAGVKTAELANEREFNDLFPECEHGAMPPFGNLYAIRVFADEALARDEQIAFNAGSHCELVKMAYEDFQRLVKPTVAPLSAPFAEALTL